MNDLQFGFHYIVYPNQNFQLFRKELSITSKGASIQALKVALDAAKKYNARTHLFNLRNSILQMYNPEATKSDDGHDNIAKVRHLLNRVDAFVLCAPYYDYSISDVLKDFLDYYFNNLFGKPLVIFAHLMRKA